SAPVTTSDAVIESVDVAPSVVAVLSPTVVSAPEAETVVNGQLTVVSDIRASVESAPVASAPVTSVATSESSATGFSSQLRMGLYRSESETVRVSGGQTASQPASVPSLRLDDYYASMASDVPVDSGGAALGWADGHKLATDDCFASLELELAEV